MFNGMLIAYNISDCCCNSYVCLGIISDVKCPVGQIWDPRAPICIRTCENSVGLQALIHPCRNVVSRNVVTNLVIKLIKNINLFTLILQISNFQRNFLVLDSEMHLPSRKTYLARRRLHQTIRLSKIKY